MRWLLTLAALITLHQPTGGVMYVNPEEIQVIAPAGIYLGKSRVLVHDTWIAVKETPEQVKRLRDGD